MTSQGQMKNRAIGSHLLERATTRATRLENTATTLAAPHNKMRARSRLRREASGVGSRYAINNSFRDPSGVLATQCDQHHTSTLPQDELTSSNPAMQGG